MAEGIAVTRALETESPNGRPLPAVLRAPAGMMPTPNEMRALKAVTGRPLSELLGGDGDDMEAAPDRLQSLAWIALRREGFLDVSYEQAGDVSLLLEEQTPDPTKPASSSSSSTSAASGE